MYGPNTDPDVRKYDDQNEWRTCPECATGMLPLKNYEIQKASESPTVGADLSDVGLVGLCVQLRQRSGNFRLA
jgi:hypothetical protein